MKNKTDLTNILAYCLEALERKEMSLEQCLDKFPQHREELNTLLGKFSVLRSLPLEKARTEFRKKGHQALLNAIKDRWPVTLSERLRVGLQSLAASRQRKFRPVGVIAAAVLAFFLVTGGVAYASDAAVPGEILYGLDRAIERVRLHMTTDVEDVIALRLGLAEERLKEFEDRIAADDIDNAQAALESYGSEIAALAKLVAGPEGMDEHAKNELINAALTVHRDVLTGVLEKVPEQAQKAIQNAIDKNNKFPGNIKDSGKPEKTGKPEKNGRPEDPGSQAPGEIPEP